MTSETDAEFLDRLEETPRYNPAYRTLVSDRLFALARRGAAVQWRPISEAPREPVAEGWTRGPLIYVKSPWGGWDVGWWDLNYNCFRMIGDDGPHDEQPTHWQPLPPPPAGETND